MSEAIAPDATHPFEALTPDFLIDAVESVGLRSDGRLFALNSYENRVYQIGIEESEPLIAKFYRPQRWSRAQIEEEHQFCYQLAEQELPVVCPLRNETGASLSDFNGFSFALYPRRGGHAPELDNLDHLYVIGKLLGRIHAIGAVQPFQHRPRLDVKSYGHDSVEFLLRHFVPAELRTSYQTLAADILQELDQQFVADDWPAIRTHGDCHVGNMLWRDDYPHFVDFDDCRMAPAIQDIWLLLSGDHPQQQQQLAEITEGYNEFYDFRPAELRLIEPLRTLRILHHSAWIARRWHDPAFPRVFPWFDSPRYWGDQILQLREQLALLREPPLTMPY